MVKIRWVLFAKLREGTLYPVALARDVGTAEPLKEPVGIVVNLKARPELRLQAVTLAEREPVNASGTQLGTLAAGVLVPDKTGRGPLLSLRQILGATIRWKVAKSGSRSRATRCGSRSPPGS